MGQMLMFREQQSFRQPWLWIVFACVSIPVAALLGYGIYQQIVLGQPFGNRPLGDTPLMVIFGGVLLLHTLVIALFWYARLDTEVTRDEVAIRFRPFHLRPRRIALKDITDARARQYSAIGEFGGWGIRIGMRGWAYNVSGDHGVQLTLVSGRRILIGSQRSEELEAAIREARAS
jgi:ABC-type tungstate transport system substrate-binding protein